MKKPEFKLDKKGKKLVLSIGAGAAAAAILVGVVFGVRGRGEPVGVYPFVMVGMTEFWGDNQESYGPVTTDKIQTVFLSDTQTVTEVKVKQGDQVKKGDVLLTYDTTLSELELERKRLDVEKAKLQVKEAEEELARINQMEPMGDVNITLPEVDYGEALSNLSTRGYLVHPDSKFDGSTKENPLVCWLGEAKVLDNTLLNYLYATAVNYQLENAKISDSSASQTPDGETEELPVQPSETTATTEETTVSTEAAEETQAATEQTQPLEDDEQEDPDDGNDWYREQMTLFQQTAPTSLEISSRSVSRGGVFLVEKDNAANLFFSTDITDPVHSRYVQWQLSPAAGPLQGMSNGYGHYTLSGVPKDTGTFQYVLTARYAPEGGPVLTQSFPFTLSVVESVKEQEQVNSFYMVLRVTQEDRLLAPKTVWQGIQVTAYDGGGFGFRLYDAAIEDPMLEQTGEDDSLDLDFGSGMTAAEIAKLRKEQVKKVKDLAAAAKMTESEYNLMEREFNDGNIRATLDGEVVTLLTEEESKENHTPMMKVSGGGGFYVEGSVSELEKDTLKPGQEVTINDWNTGMTYTGEVQSIGDFPVTGNGWNGMGNPNASYYPFHVFIDGSADLQEGSYVSVTYSAAEAENGIYLENPFLRTDDGEPYVYVRGKNGRLEKRLVTTGKSLWGSYTQILSGLTEEDYIAFPYGKTVKPGAATEEAELSALYGY